MVILYKQIL